MNSNQPQFVFNCTDKRCCFCINFYTLREDFSVHSRNNLKFFCILGKLGHLNSSTMLSNVSNIVCVVLGHPSINVVFQGLVILCLMVAQIPSKVLSQGGRTSTSL